MNFRTSTLIRPCLGCFALFLFLVSPVRSYEAPNFDYLVFDRDGIFLEPSDEEGLLEALAAIACNFPAQSKVDDDLREKAIAIALKLDPLHFNSRQAHEALTHGKIPEKTGYFDSLSLVSETLWSAALLLTDDPVEPEEKKLAGYLMELSLVLHPDPAEERLTTYAVAVNDLPLVWSNFVSLDPIENQSTTRSTNLILEATELLRRPSLAKNGMVKPGNSSTIENHSAPSETDKNSGTKPQDYGGADRPEPAMRPLPDDFEPIIRSIQTFRNIASVNGNPMSNPISGIFTLTIREAESSEEKGLLTSSPGELAGNLPLPIISSPNGPDFDGMRTIGYELLPVDLEWIEGTVVEFSLKSDQAPARPWRVNTNAAKIPAIALLESALKGKGINEDIVLGGGRRTMPGNIEENIEAAALIGRPYFMVPGSVRQDLMAYLNRTGNLDILFEPELIAFTVASQAIDKMTSPTRTAWLKASESFAEIMQDSERMPLRDLAKDTKIQKRLEAILKTAPDHLSARAMLEYGKEARANQGVMPSEDAEE